MDERMVTFSQYFKAENKEMALAYCMELLQKEKVDIISLYEKILAPCLNNLECDSEDIRICIWKEHIKTAMIRTIVECSYPYVIRERNKRASNNEKTAVIICPPEEYHDLGARMVADFFTICGCRAIFVGSNTPIHDFYNAINLLRPEIIAISVSDYYNLVATKKMIEQIKNAASYPITIVVGGNAFKKNTEMVSAVGADYYAKSFSDIEMVVRNEV